MRRGIVSDGTPAEISAAIQNTDGIDRHQVAPISSGVAA
jgi:hypothetical protein